MNNKWISVKDKLPANNEVIILLVEKDGRKWVTVGMYSIDPVITSAFDKKVVWYVYPHESYEFDAFITHWMSLPEKPE